MGFSRQEYWSELPFPSPGDLPGPEIKPASLMTSELAGRFFITSTTWEARDAQHRQVRGQVSCGLFTVLHHLAIKRRAVDMCNWIFEILSKQEPRHKKTTCIKDAVTRSSKAGRAHLWGRHQSGGPLWAGQGVTDQMHEGTR